jgi:hypothetical protein
MAMQSGHLQHPVGEGGVGRSQQPPTPGIGVPMCTQKIERWNNAAVGTPRAVRMSAVQGLTP